MRVSYSKLDTYKQCPRKYKFYIDKAPQDPSRTLALRFGSAVHAALEFAYAKRYKYPSPERVINYYRGLMQQESDPQVLKLFEKGIPALEKYLAKNEAAHMSIVEVEKKFMIEIGRGHQLEGIIDRLDMLPDGSFEIIDYKTGQIPDAESLSKNWQLAIYQFAKQRKLQTSRIKASLVYIAFDGHKLTYQFGKNELERIHSEILDLIARIEADNVYAPRVSALCNTCAYQPICPAWTHKYNIKDQVLTGKIKDTDVIDIQSKIDKLLVLTSTIKKLEKESKQLKEIVAIFGKENNMTRLFSDLGTVSLSFQKKRAYDAARIAEVLRENLLRKIVKTLDTKKLEKALPYLTQEERKQIEAFTTEKESHTIAVRPTIEENEDVEELLT